jgi:hypothetical protein
VKKVPARVSRRCHMKKEYRKGYQDGFVDGYAEGRLHAPSPKIERVALGWLAGMEMRTVHGINDHLVIVRDGQKKVPVFVWYSRSS